jgi:hypothetical protein
MKRSVCITLCIILLPLWTCCVRGGLHKEKPVAVNGVLDVKDWNFEEDGPLMLDGEWKFIWLKSDPEFSKTDYDDSEWDIFTIPAFWNDKVKSKYGYAWFRLKVINVKSDHILAMYQVNTPTAYELYYNGSIILKAGKTGKTREESVPQRLPLYTQIDCSNEFCLAWNISNFDNTNGGPGFGLKMGLYTDIRDSYLLKNFLIVFVLGIIVMMAMYHFFYGFFSRRIRQAYIFRCFVSSSS